MKYQVTPSSNQNNKEYDDLSTIKLGECETKLKNFYNINEDESLLILKADIYYEGLLAPIVIYEIYHPRTKERLDLIHCQDVQINISIPVKINENELFKHDPTNEFYNDICFTYTSENGTDITLNDRQDEFINNNLTLCENGCKYNSYNSKSKKVICDCFIKLELPLISEIKVDREKLKKNFMDIKSLININIMKCYKVLLSKQGLIKNIGSYILLSFIFIYIISYNVFFLVEYEKLVEIIDKIIKNKLSNKKGGNTIENNINVETQNRNEIDNKDNDNGIINKNSIKKKIAKKSLKIITGKGVTTFNECIKKKNNPPPKNNKETKKFKNQRKSQSKLNLNHSLNKSSYTNNIIDINKKNDENKTIKLENNKIKFYVFSEMIELCLLFSIIKAKWKIVNLKNEKKSIINFNDYELNNMEYDEALKYDKRTYFQYYWSLLKTKQALIFSFIQSNDYNSTITKICLFVFSFALYLTINALFFTDSTIHEIYEEEGNFNFIYQLPQILYSSIISSVINILIKFLSLSEKNILKLKNEKKTNDLTSEKKKLLNILRIKFIWFFNISLIFLLLFWYYLGCFCAIYKNTQIHLLKDCLISFALSLLYPLGINLLPGIFRIPSLKNNKKKCYYQISKIAQLI